MPQFLHQWAYKDDQVRAMVVEQQNREEVVRIATQAFGGKLLCFWFCFGEYDGAAITEFEDNETAMACLMSIYAEGRLRVLNTTPLLTWEQSQAAIRKAQIAIRGRAEG
ncbi:GYD domain-containing protein [Cupriavidus sp. AcVe19-6a]|uniref:GYD domain-containing protein n=1 Tax=Cupriavidus sp. AcVe19-6a TaxID=2821358 RepID=UPI001AE5788B|nr:GYD domain-containing protein [Cupriavidus sp. AcVe19-6a]MBP0639446.1 GYD domain-containing protein [Cupriavidus sp. AcVe19-6a]